MKRLMPLATALVLVSTIAAAQDAGPADAALRTAQQTAAALLRGDFAAVIDNTHPRAVEAMGGRQRAVDMARQSMQQMTDQGMSIVSYTLEEPARMVRDGTNTFTVIPATLVMKFAKGRVISRSYMLGISADGGKSWKLVDGSGLANKAARELLFPNLPAALRLPERREPEVIADK